MNLRERNTNWPRAVFAVLACLALLSVSLMGPAAVHAQEVLVIDTVANYDDDTNFNTIDVIAPGSIDLDTFTSKIAAAFNSGAGGVINFDIGVLNGIDQIEASFGANMDRTLVLVNGDESTWTTQNGGGRTPTSGDNSFGKHCATSLVCTNDHIWEIEPIDGGEVVTTMGVTVLSGLKGPFDTTVEATLDDGTNVSLSAVVPQSDGLDDTFFALDAPAGRYITRFAVYNGPPFDEDPDNTGGFNNLASFGSLDDLAFIVGPVGVDPRLQAGDADQDFDFDQLDLVQVQIAAKYLTGQSATWGEGDWNGAPGGSQGSPPAGNGRFDQLDIIAALAPGLYLTGPYAALTPNGRANDAQTSVGYNTSTGEVWVDAPAGKELTSINIDSAAGIFTGDPALNLGGSFDNDADGNIFKATFGSSFGSLSFGAVAQAGLSAESVLDDLTVVGSLAGGGDLGTVDLIYVPEPSAAVLLSVGLLASFWCSLRKRPVR